MTAMLVPEQTVLTPLLLLQVRPAHGCQGPADRGRDWPGGDGVPQPGGGQRREAGGPHGLHAGAGLGGEACSGTWAVPWPSPVKACAGGWPFLG